MKKTAIAAMLITAILLLAPLGVMEKSSFVSVAAGTSSEKYPSQSKKQDTFRLLNAETGKVEVLSEEDYIFGVVAAEMPALYEVEALKAQAVAAYTYACKKREQSGQQSYDITTDSKSHQSYISKETAIERWGENSGVYTEKIQKAIQSVRGYILTYDGQTALTVYHAISSGKTENSKDVWGQDYAYLKSVLSEGDRLSPDYISTLQLTPEQLKEKLSDIDFEGNAENYFKDAERTEAGTVKKITLCNRSVTGEKLREALALKSANFDIAFADGLFTFTVYGYGHSVGMSQNGANFMAKQGADYKEILLHYYNGCKLTKIKN